MSKRCTFLLSAIEIARATVFTCFVFGLAAYVNAQTHQPSKCIPPLQGSYVPPPGAHAWGNGWAATNMEHKAFSHCFPPPPGGGSQDHEFDSLVDALITTNPASPPFWVRAPARCRVRVTHTNSANGVDFYSTEMLQLDIAGGDFPPGVRIRESPTLPTRGQLTIQPAAQGGYNINNFFDVWTELTVNNGGTWFPSTSAAHMVLGNPSPEISSPTDNLPVIPSRYVSARGFSAPYANGIIISNVVHYGFTSSLPPPTLPGFTIHSFASEVEFQVSVNGGSTFTQYRAPATATVGVRATTNSEGTRYFETEMMQLDIAGGTLPPQIRAREHPGRASLGRTHIRPVPGGYRVGSYFDIFTELSLDSGQTWSPALCPHPVALDRTTTTIPTLSEWGLIVLALLLLTVGSIFILRSPVAGLTALPVGWNRPAPFVGAVFMRVLAAALLLWLAGVATVAVSVGTISATDVTGSLISTFIGAYWVHLLITTRTREYGVTNRI